jgi:ATP-dependent DNA ligase
MAGILAEHDAPDKRPMDSPSPGLFYWAMSVAGELRRRPRADPALPRFEPCLPRLAKTPPDGPGWIHEIKHDGFRIIARRDAARVRLARGMVTTSPIAFPSS